MRESPLPSWLRAENVTVESFVLAEEQPPGGSGWTGKDYPCRRRLRAWRRWQDTVTQWGAERGLDVSQLCAMGLYPQSRPFSAETVHRMRLR